MHYFLGICQGPYKAIDCCITEIRKQSFFSSLSGSVLDISVKWNIKYLKDPKSSLYFMQCELKNTKRETEPCKCKTWKNQNGRATGKLKDATSFLDFASPSREAEEREAGKEAVKDRQTENHILFNTGM